MWIDDIATDAHLRAWIKHCPTMKLVTSMDGKILWANAAFCEWSHYTLNELLRLTWREISVPDKNLEGDDETKTLDAYNPSYTVLKQYQPKQSQPEWGQLSVMRYPLMGEIECCLCTWDPLKNGTATAFAMAMESIGTVNKRLEEMHIEIKTVTGRTDEEEWVIRGLRMIQRNPRKVAAFAAIALSIFGLNNVLSLLQKTGFVTLPVKIETVTE